MNWFILFCYIFFAYGLTVFVTHSVGPFNIFVRLRVWADAIDENFGLLFRCQTCFPANVGWAFSLFNWFLLPIAITPFNMILSGTGLWWLAAIMDCCLTSALCRLLWNIDDYIDKNTPIFEDELGETLDE